MNTKKNKHVTFNNINSIKNLTSKSRVPREDATPKKKTPELKT